jgi:hypothetical protein
MPYEKIAKGVLLSSDERRIDLRRIDIPFTISWTRVPHYL